MNERQLEDALRAWPLAEVPTGFSADVMEKIQPRPGVIQAPARSVMKFRLTWMDYALGLFLSLLPVLAFITIATLPKRFILFLKYQWLVLQFPAYEPVLLYTFLGGMALMVLLTFLFSLRFIFPRQVALF